jgi:hypothetical protein
MNAEQEKNNKSNPESFGGLRHWVQSYARHRGAGPFIVQMTIGFVFCILIGGLSLLWGYFYFRHNDNKIGLWLSGICLSLVMIALIPISTPRWGGKWATKWGQWLYADDGQVTLPQKEKPKIKWHVVVVPILFGGCVAGSVILGFLGYLPDTKYMQPISAMYCIPFMIYLIYGSPVIKSKIAWLWPILYAFHALSVLLDIPPISLMRRDLDMLVATFGYGFVTAIITYAYSRYAFYRLRKAAQKPVNGVNLNGNGMSR